MKIKTSTICVNSNSIHIKDYNKGNFLIVGNGDTEQRFLDLGELSLVLGDNFEGASSDIYIKDKSLESIPCLIDISKKYTKVLRNSKLFVFVIKILFVILSIFSLLPLWVVLLIEELLMNIIDIGGNIYD